MIQNELDENSTTELFSVVQQEGNRYVSRKIKYYNLDAILSVGYRVNSKRGTQFRIWANQILKDYLLKGYSVNNRITSLENKLVTLKNKVQQIDLKKANTQYGNFSWQQFDKCHDRFLIIDCKEVYHMGASLKDLGKKWFAFSKLNIPTVESIMQAIPAL